MAFGLFAHAPSLLAPAARPQPLPPLALMLTALAKNSAEATASSAKLRAPDSSRKNAKPTTIDSTPGPSVTMGKAITMLTASFAVWVRTKSSISCAKPMPALRTRWSLPNMAF